MAVVFDIRNDDKSEFYDFTNVNSIIRYVSGSFTDNSDSTLEDKQTSFKTVAKGTPTQIREAFRDIELLLNKAPLWWEDNTLDEGIYIHIETESSSSPRRSLIISWQRTDSSEGASDPLLDKSSMVISDWTITRHHAWEGEPASEFTHSNIAVSCNTGGAFVGTTTNQNADHDGFEAEESADFLNDGTKPGRIVRTRIAIPQSTGGNDWDKVWIGMKPVASVNGTASDKWAAHTVFTNAFGMSTIDGDINGAFTSSLALNGQCTDIDFTDPSWQARMFNEIPHTHEDSSRGTYLVLMRLKVEAATNTVARVAMFYSWDNPSLQGGKADTYEDIYIDNTDWRMYEMGVIQVPPEGYRTERRGTGNEGLSTLAIGLSAERIAGTGSLYADYAVWIPQEHYLYIGNAKNAGSAGNYTYVYVSEDGEVIGHNSRGAPDHHYQCEISAKNWHWPADPAKKFIVVAAADMFIEDTEEHNFNKSLDIQVTVRPRYHSFNAD